MAVRSQWGNPKCLESAGARLNRWKVNSKVAEVETQETALQGEVLHSGIHASSWSAFGSVTLQIRMRIIFVLAIALSVFRWPWLHKLAPQQSAALSGTAGAREYPTLEQNCRPADLRRRDTRQKLMGKDSTAFRACLRAITR